MPRYSRSNEDLSPRKHARQERSRLTVQAILIGAAQVFERDGYEKATTDAIAERAGVSIGSLYQYYPNKDAVLVALGYCHLAESAAIVLPLLERMSSEEPISIPAVVSELVDVAIASHRGRPKLHRVLFEEMPVGREQSDAMGQSARLLVDLIADYLRRASGPKLEDPVLVATLVQQTLVNATHQFVTRPPDGFSEDDCKRELSRMLTFYLTSGTAV